MSGSLARIPIHRCPPRPIQYKPDINVANLKPYSEVNLANIWCDCPDTQFNYVKHRLCMKSNLYRIVDSYLFHHPCLVKSASYI